MRFELLTCLAAICMVCNAYAEPAAAPKPVYMTSQIQSLLNEKQEKVSKLEECDGKRKGFMIAGISTIGLTAVGIGVNIAQASKSNKLSNQIEDQNRELDKQQANLANINSQISDIKNENRRRECESDANKVWVNGRCVNKGSEAEIINAPAPQPDENAQILQCIQAIEGSLVFGLDGEKLALFTKDGYLIPGDDAVKLSKNWNYNNFTLDLISLRETVSYSSANGVQDHEKDACATLDKLRTYLATVDKSKLKHLPDFGVPGNQPLVTISGNPDGNQPTIEAGGQGGPLDMMAQDRRDRCHKSGGNYNVDSDDCQCRKPGMTQNVNKTECLCESSEFTYDETKQECVKNIDHPIPTGALQISTDWSILKNPTKDYGITKNKFCQDLHNNSLIGQSIHLSQYRDRQSALDTMIQNGAGHGYWCNQLGGQWNVTTNPEGAHWECHIDPSVCKSQSERELDARDLAEYKKYKIQCDNEKDVFMFVRDVVGAEAEIERIANDCTDKYNGRAVRDDKTKSQDGLTMHFTMISCLGATGCK